ncbi:hypothetical protein [Desulfonatronum parangueonense]
MAETERKRRGRAFRWTRNAVVVLVLLLMVSLLIRFEYAYMPPMEKVLNPERINTDIAYDYWGRSVTRQEADELLNTAEGARLLTAAHGAVEIDPEFLQLGRETFYKETFGNEIFSTDVIGFMDGPLTMWSFIRAIIANRGQGTDNLQVRVARDAIIGGREYSRGDMVNTGLDIVPGSLSVLGMKVRYSHGRIRAGITCAACHSAVDMESGKVVEGAPNLNLNIGKLIAFAPNSAGIFANAEIGSLDDLVSDASRTVTTSDGRTVALPDPELLEDAVDRIFMSWPPGSFDSTIDLVANPSQIPDSFTWQDHPYGWTGFAAAGPFMGLSVLNNNVHALNSDGISQAEASMDLFGFDKELTYAMVLQNSSRGRYRWDPESGDLPSEFFQRINPTPPTMGFNEMIHTPSFPKGSLISPDGLFISKNGSLVWFENNAMSAFQNTLAPPPPPIERVEALRIQGRDVFQAAGCGGCHSGPAYTNNRILPAREVGASPSRARANANNWDAMIFPPTTWSWDTPVPVPLNARMIEVPLDRLDMDEVRMAYAQDERGEGGFKVKGLMGLWWSPPYLHDGSIAVGRDAQTQIGIPGTFHAGIRPDPVNSLRALVDRELRRRLIKVTADSEELRMTKVTGTGHGHWVDEEAGYTRQEQDALIHYLLTLEFQEDR